MNAGEVGGQILAAGLVDEVAMDVVPVVFGSGKRYFGGIDGQQLLEDPHVVIQGDRVLHLRFKVARYKEGDRVGDMARGVIESNRYMVLGTADEGGVPWVTPVWFAQTGDRRFVWVSSPERRHSRNVRARPEVSIVIFDSQVAVGSARAVYMSASAEGLSGAELERDVALFDAASQAQVLTRRRALEDMLASAPYPALSGDGVAALGPGPRQQSRRSRTNVML